MYMNARVINLSLILQFFDQTLELFLQCDIFVFHFMNHLHTCIILDRVKKYNKPDNVFFLSTNTTFYVCLEYS